MEPDSGCCLGGGSRRQADLAALDGIGPAVPPLLRRRRRAAPSGGHVVLVLLLLCVGVGCGGPRRYGDPDAPPVAFTIELDRAFVQDMRAAPRGSLGYGMGYGSRGRVGSGWGLGLHFSSTQVYLLGYDAEAQALLFRRELHWGSNEFTVPLLPERELLLEIQAYGGREGQERIGLVAASQPQPIAITLDGAGSSLLQAPKPAETPAEDAAADVPAD